MEFKLQLKRLGADDFKAENRQLLKQLETQLAPLDETKKDDKKKITVLKKDQATLESRLAKTDALLTSIGGQLTEPEARTLILKKLHELATHELDRYLSAGKRRIIQLVENLWEKYAISSRALEAERTETLKALDGFLTGLGYFK